MNEWINEQKRVYLGEFKLETVSLKMKTELFVHGFDEDLVDDEGNENLVFFLFLILGGLGISGLELSPLNINESCWSPLGWSKSETFQNAEN